MGAHPSGYRIEGELARGGMGVVYEAIHEETGARYALKRLLLNGLVAVPPEERQRFVREARILASLRHPHVVRVHQAELEAADPYLIQELLSGGSLQERLRHGPLPVEEALTVAVKLARGLQHAHEHHVLHRDLKPDNVLFDERGEPRLVDFGIAQRLDEAERLTQTGSLLGTPSYMAPEQVRAEKELDARVDVYGLGAVLYAMLSGAAPFRGGSVLSILNRVASAAPAPLVGVPPAVEAACLKAMAKRPEDRYPSAAAMADSLSDALSDALAGVAAGSSPRARSLALSAAGATLVLGAALFGVWATSHPEGPPPEAPPRADEKTVPAPPEPKPPRDPLAAAEEALREGDGARALKLLEAAPGGTRRDALRGLGLLLQGKLSAARPLLARGWQEACNHEASRLDLERMLAKSSPLVRREQTPTLLELARLLPKHAQRSFSGVALIAPELRRRLAGTVAHVILEAQTSGLRGRSTQVRKLLRDTERVAGREPRLAIAHVYVEWLTSKGRLRPALAKRLRGLLPARDAVIGLGRPYRATWAGLRVAFETGGATDPLRLGPTSILHDAAPTALYAQCHLLKEIHDLLAKRTQEEMVRRLRAGQEEAGVAAYRSARYHRRQCLAYAVRERKGVAPYWETSDLAGLLLFAGDAAAARPLIKRLPSGGKRGVTRALLRAELLILEGRLDAAEAALAQLPRHHRAKHCDDETIRAAILARRGKKARALIALVNKSGRKARPPLLWWRGREDTEDEINAVGIRVTLLRALKKKGR